MDVMDTGFSRRARRAVALLLPLLTACDDGVEPTLVPPDPEGVGRIALVAHRDEHSWRRGGSFLAIMDADGTDLRIIGEASNASSPTWSPDGRQVAFTRYGDSTVNGLYVHDAASGVTRRLLLDVRVHSPTWSPDGSRIAFSTGSDTVHAIRADGSGRTTLGRASAAVAWGPGDRLAYLAPDTVGGVPSSPMGVYVRSLATGATVRASPRDGAQYMWPRWSPDGQLAAVRQRYDAESGKDHQLVVLDPATATSRVAYADSSQLERFSWSPDGRHLAVTRSPCCARQVWIVRADGTRSWPITPGSLSQTRFYGHSDPAWSPVR